MRNPSDDSARQPADLVREVFTDPDLDPVVRDLAIERLEAVLLARARSLVGARDDLAVTLDEAGTITVFGGSAEITDAALSARLERALLASLASTVGVARLDAKRGVRASRAPAREQAACDLAETPSWPALAQRLTSLIRLQHRRIVELEAALGTRAEPDAMEQELQRVEAMLRAMRAT